MAKRIISAALIVCLLLQMGCATRKAVVPIGQNDYGSLNSEKRIFVTMKSGEKYEIRDFVVSEKTIVGTVVSHDAPANRAIELQMQDVASIEVEKSEGGTPVWVYVVGGLAVGVLIGLLAVVIACSSAD